MAPTIISTPTPTNPSPLSHSMFANFAGKHRPQPPPFPPCTDCPTLKKRVEELEKEIEHRDQELHDLLNANHNMEKEIMQLKVKEEGSKFLDFKVQFLEKELTDWKMRYDKLLSSITVTSVQEVAPSNPRTP